MKYLYEQILNMQTDTQQNINRQLLQEVTVWITRVQSVHRDKKSQEQFLQDSAVRLLLS